MRIVYDNAIDTATLSASPALVTTLPEENLQNISRSKVARTTGLSTQTILGNLSVAKLVSSLVLWRHNFTSNATIQLELYPLANQAGTKVYDSGEISPYDAKTLGDLLWGIDPLEASVFDSWGVYWSEIWFDAVAAASFKLTIKDSANPDGYMQVSRAYLGAYIGASFNPSYGMQLGWDEKVKQERTAGGTLYSDPAAAYRQLQFTLEMLSEVDRPKFLEFTRVVGMTKDFFISIYPELGGEIERDHSMLAKMIQYAPQTHTFYAHYSQSFQMQET
jgi:hypothetical protein